MLTDHRAARLDGGVNGLLEVRAGTIGLEADGGLLDKLGVAAQTGGVLEVA